MDDCLFLQAFENTTLSSEQWDHRAHIRVAYLYLKSVPLAIAIDQLRVGIQQMNQAHGKPETEYSGYHETMTIAWARLVAAAIAAYPTAPDFAAFITAQNKLLETALIWRYYSPEHILTRQARQQFVEPDIRPFPTVMAPTPQS